MKKNQNGFSPLETILVLAIMILLGAIGWLVYKNQHKSAPVSAQTSASQKSASNASTTTPPVSTSSSEWKTYCDTTNNNCFTYPSDWGTNITNSGGIAGAEIYTPGDSITARVSYSDPYTKDEGPQSFTTTSINHPTGNNDLAIVGGYYNSDYSPGYYLVDENAVATYSLKEGKISHFSIAPRFKNHSGDSDGQMTAYPVGAVFSNSSQAAAWFKTKDAATALKIIESFYTK